MIQQLFHNPVQIPKKNSLVGSGRAFCPLISENCENNQINFWNSMEIAKVENIETMHRAL